MHIVVETVLLILHVIYEMLMSLVKWFLPTTYKSVENEVCLITGGGSGIGRLMALEFAKRGAVLVLWDVNVKGNEETAEMIRQSGGKAFAEKCDVSNREEVYKMAQKAKGVAGDVTILVNNAGIVYGKDFMEITDEQLEKTMQVNSLAHFWTVRAFLPSMMEKNYGHIVTIASVMGLFAAPGMPGYVASKFAAVGFNNGLELDLRKYKKDGIRTTVVCPYHIMTGMFTGVKTRFSNLLPSLTPEQCVESIMHAVLTDRVMVCIPRSMYISYNIQTWMPHKVGLLLHDFLGSFDSMTGFVPARGYQKSISTES
ncbi:retinol dehydrogenase 10-like [Styela clava]|uniref:retinol dehydrogenase 10-like n=1 Tax=Styela clava TaxID=7725 RepID=UPI00193995DD|nr:retinol dehydrogenase 10-like [Styela clava]